MSCSCGKLLLILAGRCILLRVRPIVATERPCFTLMISGLGRGELYLAKVCERVASQIQCAIWRKDEPCLLKPFCLMLFTVGIDCSDTLNYLCACDLTVNLCTVQT